MKHMLLTGMLGLSALSFGQTTLFSDDFESGSGNWTLNSTDLSGSQISNHWVINNSYTGGSGSFTCLGFPFGFTLGNTQPQPSGISNQNGNYLHISSFAGETSGVTNANFIAADGLCNFDETYFTKMTNAVSTAGYENVTFSFWNIVSGESGTAFGEVYYSLDNGASWQQKSTNISAVSSWTAVSLTDAAWDDVPSLKFAFRFVNTTASAPSDPPLSVDDVSITGTTVSNNSIATNSITTQNWCYNDVINLTVPFTVTGTMNVGNIYTAQLSDASGSFAAPTTIGTLNSTGTGAQSLLCSIPGGTPAGNGYRIRVNSSNPATTGADNGTNLVMHALPSVSVLGNPVSGTICLGASIALQASGASSYIWTPSTALSNIATAATSANPTDTITYTVIGTDQNGCNGTANYTVNVVNCAGIEEANQVNFTVSPNPTTGTIQISSESTSTIDQVFVVNALGQKTNVAFNNGSISLDAFAAGVYTLVIEHSTGESQVRVVKQ